VQVNAEEIKIPYSGVCGSLARIGELGLEWNSMTLPAKDKESSTGNPSRRFFKNLAYQHRNERHERQSRDARSE
jgi:hypothetical protein